MKVFVAFDSFKGSISSQAANQMVAKAFREEGFTVVTKAVADGGEGSVAALLNNGGLPIAIPSVNSLFQPVIDTVAYFPSQQTAFVEVANTIGLHFNHHHSPYQLSSYGVGLTIKTLVEQYKVKHIVLMLGGTGTIDAGIGMGEALGLIYYDQENRPLTKVTGKDLKQIAKIETQALTQYQTIQFSVGHDVIAPLLGPTGAVYGFGQQKGLLDTQFLDYETMMCHFLNVSGGEEQKGDGAAGGLGYFCRHFLQATTQSGFSYIAEYGQFNQLKEIDLVITGEGQCDEQSLLGKLPLQVANYFQKPTLLLVGSIAHCHLTVPKPIIGIYPITAYPCSLQEAMKQTESFLYYTAKQIAKTLSLKEEYNEKNCHSLINRK